jgi:hypothetical protein
MTEGDLAFIEGEEFVRVVLFDMVVGLYTAPVTSHDFVGEVSFFVAVHVHYLYPILLFLVRCLLDEFLQQQQVRIIIRLDLYLLGLLN